MPEFIHIQAKERLAPPVLLSDACGVCITGVTKLAYNTAATPVNIKRLEWLPKLREDNGMALQGSLGALTVYPIGCGPDASPWPSLDLLDGFQLANMPPVPSSYNGIFAHHDISFVFTPNIKVEPQELFLTEERETATTISLIQYNPKKCHFQEIEITTKCKSFNFSVEEVVEPKPMKIHHWIHHFFDAGVKASVSIRTFRFNADVNVAYMFPEADEEDPALKINRELIQAFEDPREKIFDSFQDFNFFAGKVSAV